MSADQVRQDAARVLLARCCDHPALVAACECAEQVAADVEVLARHGLLRDDWPDVAHPSPRGEVR